MNPIENHVSITHSQPHWALDVMSLDELNNLIKDINEEIELRKFKAEKILKLRSEFSLEKLKIKEEIRKYEEEQIYKSQIRIRDYENNIDQFSESEDDRHDEIVESAKVKKNRPSKLKKPAPKKKVSV